jgi:hypothetical protein
LFLCLIEGVHSTVLAGTGHSSGKAGHSTLG